MTTAAVSRPRNGMSDPQRGWVTTQVYLSTPDSGLNNRGMSMPEIDEFKDVWEMFFDDAYFGTWCVRDKRDKRFFAPRSFHFKTEQDAVCFLSSVKKAYPVDVNDKEGACQR